MGKTITTMSFIILALVLTLIFIGFKAATLGQQAKSYADLSSSVLGLLHSVDINCPATDKEPLQLKQCVDDLMVRSEQKSFEEFGFQQFNLRTNESGFIAVKNKGIKTFGSGMFSLLLNRERQDSGCVVPGNISKDVTCKLYFKKLCERGDLLEVEYEDKVVYMKNC